MNNDGAQGFKFRKHFISDVCSTLANPARTLAPQLAAQAVALPWVSKESKSQAADTREILAATSRLFWAAAFKHTKELRL